MDVYHILTLKCILDTFDYYCQSECENDTVKKTHHFNHYVFYFAVYKKTPKLIEIVSFACGKTGLLLVEHY